MYNWSVEISLFFFVVYLFEEVVFGFWISIVIFFSGIYKELFFFIGFRFFYCF